MANLPALPDNLDPTYLALLEICPELAAINADAAGGISAGMPPSIVAAKGRFTIKEGGTETICKFPEGHAAAGQPIGVLSCVILRGKPTIEKAWYASAFTPGQEPQSPDCFSNDGVRPDPSSRLKQCESCAGCAQNVFGSGKNQDGTPSKGKACADRKVLAIFAQNAVYRFAVPPASLGQFVAYTKQLDARGIHLPTVITAIGFDEIDDYKLTFTFGGMIAPDGFKTKILPLISAPETMEIVGVKPAAPALPAGQAQGAIEDKSGEAKDAAAKAAEAAKKADDDKKAKAKKAKEEKEAAAKAAAEAAKNQSAVDPLFAGLEGLGGEAATETKETPAGEPSDEDILAQLNL